MLNVEMRVTQAVKDIKHCFEKELAEGILINPKHC